MPSFTETMLERYVRTQPLPRPLRPPSADSCSLPALEQSDEITVATQHPFLAAAGRHELTRDKLSEWLTQDRCYALHGCECMRFLVHPRTNRPHPHSERALVTREATPSALGSRQAACCPLSNGALDRLRPVSLEALLATASMTSRRC